MIRIYPEQLGAQLREGLRACYLLAGNEPLLLQESADAIRAAAVAQGFEEHLSFTLDAQTDWESLFASCQALSLFAQRQTMTLLFPENGPNAAMAEQLNKLASLLHADILLI
ncbi:MAG TPA: DNA polymerase III subunit delta, partial [Pantoea septica]|nr:DNA polymerase III subunit delta [Pantoea septica]